MDGGLCVTELGEGRNLDSTLRENRVFAPPAEFAAKAHVKSLEQYEAMYRRSVEQPEEFWAEAAAELDWFAPWTKVLEGEGTGREVVRRRQAEPLAQLRRPPCAGRAQGQGRAALGGRAGRSPAADLRRAARAGAAVCQCAEGAGHQEGRPRRDLHGHVSGAGDCAAGLCAHRRDPLGHLRRIRRPCDCGPRERLAVRRRDDAGHELPARRRGQAEGDCG